MKDKERINEFLIRYEGKCFAIDKKKRLKKELKGAVSALTFENVKSCFELNLYEDAHTCIIT